MSEREREWLFDVVVGSCAGIGIGLLICTVVLRLVGGAP